MTAGPLTQFRVLDLTQGVAGPYATKLLSGYGADVLKVERPDAGDPARRLGPFPNDEPHPETSGMYLLLNTGKRSLTLNLKTATGQQLLHRLCQDVDLVIENFRPGTLGRLGLSDDQMEQLNPRATLVSLSSFGPEGPYRDLAADDLLLYAMGGVLSVTGQEDREPVKIGLYAPLFLAGAVTAAFALAALLGARRSGRGERVQLSIMDILASSMDRGAPNLMAHAYTGEMMSKRAGVGRGSALLSGVYPCADGYVQVTMQAAWWERLCRTIGRPELGTDPYWTSNLFNPAFAHELDALVLPFLLAHSKQEVMEKAQSFGLPITAVNSMADVFRDPQLRDRGFFTTLDHPFAGKLEYPGLPFRIPLAPGALSRAPLLGEHTVAVLTEQLGYCREDVVRLRQRGVI